MLRPIRSNRASKPSLPRNGRFFFMPCRPARRTSSLRAFREDAAGFGDLGAAAAGGAAGGGGRFAQRLQRCQAVLVVPPDHVGQIGLSFDQRRPMIYTMGVVAPICTTPSAAYPFQAGPVMAESPSPEPRFAGRCSESCSDRRRTTRIRSSAPRYGHVEHDRLLAYIKPCHRVERVVVRPHHFPGRGSDQRAGVLELGSARRRPRCPDVGHQPHRAIGFFQGKAQM